MEPEIDPKDVATAILTGFDHYRTAFKAITSGAQARFEQGEWIEAQRASADRIELYDRISADTVAAVAGLLRRTTVTRDFWCQVKQRYADLITDRTDPELAQTVFNTVYRKLYPGQILDDEIGRAHV